MYVVGTFRPASSVDILLPSKTDLLCKCYWRLFSAVILIEKNGLLKAYTVYNNRVGKLSLIVIKSTRAKERKVSLTFGN